MPSIINSDDGVVSGTSGLKTTGGNDGILALQNNGTTNVTVTAAGNLLVGTTTTGSTGVSLNGTYNVGWIQSAGESIPNIFRQTSSAATVIANGYRFSATSNGFASSFSSSYAKCAISCGTVAGAITFYTDTASAVAAGTDVTPTERARIDSSGNWYMNSGYGSAAIAYGCRAWVNFNGTGTVAIRASGNVSTISDNGTGNYTVNFTNAFVDTSYSGVFGCNDNGNTSTMCYRTGGTKSTTAFQVSTASGVAVLADNDMCMVAVFR
jgi:hypothetical protein